MKRLYIATALLVAVVTACVLTHRYQHHQLDWMLARLDRIEQLAEEEETEAAVALAKELATDYAKVSDRISCYVAHGELRDSRETAAILPTLLQHGSKTDWQAELCRLRAQLIYLRQIDDPLLQNIL